MSSIYDLVAVDNVYKLTEESNKLRRLSQVQSEENKECFDDKNLPSGWKVVTGTNELNAPFFLYGGWFSVPPSIFYSEIQCIIIIRIIIRIT